MTFQLLRFCRRHSLVILLAPLLCMVAACGNDDDNDQPDVVILDVGHDDINDIEDDVLNNDVGADIEDAMATDVAGVGPYQIDRIEGDPNIQINSVNTYLVYWEGDPVFPVLLEGEIVECNLAGPCTGGAVSVLEEENPISFTYNCACAGAIDECPEGSQVLSVTLTDALGRATEPVELTLNCVQQRNTR